MQIPSHFTNAPSPDTPKRDSPEHPVGIGPDTTSSLFTAIETGQLETLRVDLAKAVHRTTPSVMLVPDWVPRFQGQLDLLVEILSTTNSGPEWGTIADAVKRFGLKRSTFYNLMDNSFIKSKLAKTDRKNVSGRKLIYFPSVRAYLDQCPEGGTAKRKSSATKKGVKNGQ